MRVSRTNVIAETAVPETNLLVVSRTQMVLVKAFVCSRVEQTHVGGFCGEPSGVLVAAEVAVEVGCREEVVNSVRLSVRMVLAETVEPSTVPMRQEISLTEMEVMIYRIREQAVATSVVVNSIVEDDLVSEHSEVVRLTV